MTEFVEGLEPVVPFIEEDAALDGGLRALCSAIERREWPLQWEDTD